MNTVMNHYKIPVHRATLRKMHECRICDLLKWTPDKLKWFRFNTGLQFLEVYFSKNEHGIKQLSPRKQFWDWWVLQWDARDSAFVDDWDGLEDKIPLKDRVSIYKDINNPTVLASEIYPPSIVYPVGFTQIRKLLS